MKKLLAIAFISGCVCACADAYVMQPKPPLDASFFTPPRTVEVVVNDKPARLPSETIEADVYRASLVRIQATITIEASALSVACSPDRPKIDCTTQRQAFCEIPVLVDSRGGQHQKPYCIGGSQ